MCKFYDLSLLKKKRGLSASTVTYQAWKGADVEKKVASYGIWATCVNGVYRRPTWYLDETARCMSDSDPRRLLAVVQSLGLDATVRRIGIDGLPEGDECYSVGSQTPQP